MKKILFFVIITILLFSGCSINPVKYESVSNETAVYYDGYIYFQNYNVKLNTGTYGAPVFRQKPNGKDTEQVTEDMGQNITIYDNRLYYSNEADNNIYSVKLDGSDKKMHTDTYSRQPILHNGLLYIVRSYEETYSLFTLDKEGKFTLVKEGGFNDPLFDGNKLYFKKSSADTKTGSLSCLDLTTLKETVIYNKPGKPLGIKGDSLYFSSLSEQQVLYKIKKAGGTAEKMTDYGVSDLIFYDKKMYFVSEDNGVKVNGGGELYVSDENGQNRKRLSEDNSCTNISIVDKWIYYTSWKRTTTQQGQTSPFEVTSYRVPLKGGTREKVLS
ncbi:MAG: hypothetical protein BGN88_10860 [Clostridiales bacterium 43-6]|nr:MAG: hypothetical protein BGN88_10860 [Clostridiales bacterium 43-6]